MRVRFSGTLALFALLLSACSSAPVSVQPTPVHFRACQVSEKNTDTQADSEQITYALQKAKIANGIHLLRTALTLASNSTEAVFEPMLKHNCTIVVTSGAALAPLAAKAAALHPDVNFLTVVYNEGLDEVSLNNFHTIRFDVRAAAFLAGYAAASTSKTQTVAVVAGVDNPRTKQYVLGFKAGVAQYNLAQGVQVSVLGDETLQERYLGSTSDPQLVNLAVAQADAFDADVIFVAAGPASRGASEVALAQKIQLIFADSDWWLDPAAESFKSQILTSVKVNLSELVYQNTVSALQGSFSELPSMLVADLANSGTGLTETHNIAFSVLLANELAQLTEDINSGKVTIK